MERYVSSKLIIYQLVTKLLEFYKPQSLSPPSQEPAFVSIPTKVNPVHPFIHITLRSILKLFSHSLVSLPSALII
jgi:hypothetical protein